MKMSLSSPFSCRSRTWCRCRWRGGERRQRREPALRQDGIEDEDENGDEKVIKDKKNKTWSPCRTILFAWRGENLFTGSRPVHCVHFEVGHCNDYDNDDGDNHKNGDIVLKNGYFSTRNLPSINNPEHMALTAFTSSSDHLPPFPMPASNSNGN